MAALLRAAIPPFLLLVTPFVTFVQHQHYGVLRPEVLAFAGALAVLALLLGSVAQASRAGEVAILAFLVALFADIQLDEPGEKKLLAGFIVACAALWAVREHAARIVSVAMAVMLAAAALPQARQSMNAAPADTPDGRERADRPFVLHVVLDEHIGVEGLPPDLTPVGFTRDLQKFFADRGFRLFGRAYSEYSSTLWSLGQLLNLAPNGYTTGLTTAGSRGGTFRLLRSAYLDTIARQGYAIRIYQPEYLDMCTSAVSPGACHTYPANSLEALDSLRVPAPQKLLVVAGVYLSRSELHGRAKSTYEIARRTLATAGVPVPEWSWERSTSAPLGTMPLFDAIAGDIARARRGDFILAHLLMPHYPYVFDAACAPRPPTQWLTRSKARELGLEGDAMNPPASRALRYRRYLDQVACGQRKIGELLDAIPAALRRDAIIIVQGDHGSRIGLVDPLATMADSLAPSDYADHFSTLFALRAPGIEPGYDTQVAPITCLLRTFVRNGLSGLSGLDACAANPAVHLSDGTGPRRHPMPEFWPVQASRAGASH